MNIKLTIGAIPVSMIDLVWDRCTPHLERVIEKAPNDINLETMKSSLLQGKTLLVTISEGSEIVAVNILETCTYETGHKVLFIPITGGDRLHEWLADFLDIAHAIARDYQCSELRGMARPGWIKVLKEHGWNPVHTIIGCPVKQAEAVNNVTDINIGESL